MFEKIKHSPTRCKVSNGKQKPQNMAKLFDIMDAKR